MSRQFSVDETVVGVQQLNGRKIFLKHLLKKKSHPYERLMLVSNFIGELCNFDVCPVSIIIDILQICLKDFYGINVRICCFIVNRCGRYLCVGCESKKQADSILGTMDRLLKVKALGYATKVLIEEALYSTSPPIKRCNICRVSLVEEYMSYLIDVSPYPPEILCQKFAMLPWCFGNTTKNNVFVEILFLSNIGSADWACKTLVFLKLIYKGNTILQDRFLDILTESCEETIFLRHANEPQKFQFLLSIVKTCIICKMFRECMLSSWLLHLMDEIEEGEKKILSIDGVVNIDLIKHEVFCMVDLTEAITDKLKSSPQSLIYTSIFEIQIRVSSLLTRYKNLSNIKNRIKYRIERCLVQS